MDKFSEKKKVEIKIKLNQISELLTANNKISKKSSKLSDESETELLLISGYLKLILKKTKIGKSISESENKKLKRIYLKIKRIREFISNSK